MQYDELRPTSALLRPYVRSLWSLRSAAGRVERISPDGCVELVVHLGERSVRLQGGAESANRCAVVGQARAPLAVRLPGNVDTLGVRFEPAGASAFFRPAMGELTDASWPLDALWPGSTGPLLETLATCARQQRFACLESTLLARMRTSGSVRAVTACVQRITASGGRVRIDDLASEVGSSPRSIQRAFVRRVGIGPKLLARITRFQSAVRRLRDDAPGSWCHFALDHGYADQSHLIREFQAFGGLSPRRYLGTRCELNARRIAGV